MTAYQITMLVLATGILAQAVAGGIAFECALLRRLPAATRGLWFVLGCGSLLLGLHHGYTLELAMKTGLFDLRQALLVALAGVCCAVALVGLSRRA